MTRTVTLRPAGWRDLARLYRWRNDPETRAMMRQTGRLALREHVGWFWRVSRATDTRQYIAEDAGVPIGRGRLDLVGACADFDVIIAPSARGRGYGTALILALVDAARALGCQTCRADIRTENVASRIAFARAGFVPVAEVEATPVSTYVVMERPC